MNDLVQRRKVKRGGEKGNWMKFVANCKSQESLSFYPLNQVQNCNIINE